MKQKKNSHYFDVSFKVNDAFKEDAGKGIARIDPDQFFKLNLNHGDMVELFYAPNKKRTAAYIHPSKVKDKGTNIIRIDSSSRKNLNLSLGSQVKLRKIDAVNAEELEFSGVEESEMFPNIIKLNNLLNGRIMHIDDKLLSFYYWNNKIVLIIKHFVPDTEVVIIKNDTKLISLKKEMIASEEEINIIKKNKIVTDKINRIIVDEINKEISEGDKYLQIEPKRAISHYKKALSLFQGNKNGDLLCRLATAYIELGSKDREEGLFLKAKRFYEDAIKGYLNEIGIIENNLKELNSLIDKKDF